MEALQALPDVSRVSDRVVRVLGQNPGKFTLQGTNTYLVGKRPPYILIDTGEGRDTYPPLLESALRSPPPPSDATSEQTGGLTCFISDVIITHQHQDHFGGLKDVLTLIRRLWDDDLAQGSFLPKTYVPPRIHKFPMSDTFESSSSHSEALTSIVTSLIPASFTPATEGPLHALHDGQKLKTADETATLEILHTPGHTPDSVCILLHEERALFTADSVLGQGTAVFEDLGAYIQSLQRILSKHDTNPTDEWKFETVFPGHGPVVEDGPALISTYIKHRTQREEQIVSIMSSAPPSQAKEGEDVSPGPGSSWTIWNIVGQIYKDYPENLWLPAAHGVGLHLKKLKGEGRAQYVGGEGINERWRLVSKL